MGDREVSGILKAYDRIPDLVLQETIEHREQGDRELEITIIRGPLIKTIMPNELSETENPF